MRDEAARLALCGLLIGGTQLEHSEADVRSDVIAVFDGGLTLEIIGRSFASGDDDLMIVQIAHSCESEDLIIEGWLCVLVLQRD